jgi:hypothetical protein
MKPDKRILFFLLACMFVVLHNIVPHHHRFESHLKTNECESECPIEHGIDEYEHSFPEYCHTFNNIKLYDRKYNQQKNTIQFTLVSKTNFNQFENPIDDIEI